jgi:hypothetical protein
MTQHSAILAILNSSRKPLPPIPSRQELLGINTSFMGGIIIDSPTYKKMPWWDAALSWCDLATRQLVYAAKKANQAQLATGPETHCILEVPSGAPLYNEWNQFYDPAKFGPLDWTNRLTKLDKQFDDLCFEIIEAGFKVHIAMDENFHVSIQVIQLVAQRLKDLGISKYCVAMPGYDGVFYGWPPDWIAEWFNTSRAINPDLSLIMEFDPGHIPVGNGPADYAPDGLLKNCDGILAETRWPPDNTIWGVFERCYLGYKQPPDQDVDFPPAPFYLLDCDRGPRYFNGFETNWPYNWVRINPDNDDEVTAARAQLSQIRGYFRSVGSQYNG